MRKKIIERNHLENFFSNASLSYKVHNIKVSETPDFELYVDSKLTSVEHTTLVDSSLIKIESYQDRIVKNAQKLFEAKYSEKLYVLVTFKNIILKGGKTEQEKYTEEVFNIVERIYINNRGFKFHLSSRGKTRGLSQTLEHLSVDNTLDFSHWQHFGAYVVDCINMDVLQQIIIKKEEKLKKYSKKYHENWLLIVSNLGAKSSAIHTDFINFPLVKSKFDKIYLYNYMPDKVIKIK